MTVIADDDPATTHRIASVARVINPTMRIIARTRYITEIEPLVEVGADRVIAEELESIVQLFAEVLRDYRISPEEIEAHEAVVRSGSYAALLSEAGHKEPVVVCHPGEDCFDTRTVVVRSGTPAHGKTLTELELEKKFNISLRSVRRDGKEITEPLDHLRLRTGDELVIAGTSEAFTRSASIFRATPFNPERPSTDSLNGAPSKFDIETAISLSVPRPHPVCSHIDQTRAVIPSARGCEDCLRIGDAWVHLRICMTCGHVGCCDSSQNKHATKHSLETGHPIIKSLERGEDWAWCYVDKTML
jgi:CPA2 family monovalent cation:H+ antiporter-2